MSNTTKVVVIQLTDKSNRFKEDSFKYENHPPYNLGRNCIAFPDNIARKSNFVSDQSDPQFGSDSVAVDTSTGLGWLNLTETAGLSYQQVLSETQAGGMFSGFHFATVPEVLDLYQSAGISGTGEYPAATSPILSLISLIGATSYQDGHPESFGISGTSDSAGAQVVPGLDFFYNTGIPEYEVTGVPRHTTEYGQAFSATTVGSWLVKAVPEPSDTSIFILAAAVGCGFALLHRRQKPAPIRE